jgi:chromate transporter
VCFVQLSQPTYRRALPGLNSSAVGLVVAAVFQMSFKVREISPFKDASVVIGILAFYATHFGVPTGTNKGEVWKMPAPLAVGRRLHLIVHRKHSHIIRTHGTTKRNTK